MHTQGNWGSDYETTDTFVINNANELKQFSDLVNSGIEYTFEGKTVTLGNDIVLNDTADWESWDETTVPENVCFFDKEGRTGGNYLT